MSTSENHFSPSLHNLEPDKAPKPIFDNIFAFPPNRETGGSVSYLILEKEGNILLDCPPWDDFTLKFLKDLGGVSWLVVSGKGTISKTISNLHQTLSAKVIIQEQEAYLLPQLNLTSFHREFSVSEACRLIWTPGNTPGASCLYYKNYGGVLFTGRHLLPNSQGQLTPLRTGKTFHWFRQLASLEALLKIFTPDTLNYIVPGASIGLLKGKPFVEHPLAQLSKLDLDSLRHTQILL